MDFFHLLQPFETEDLVFLKQNKSLSIEAAKALLQKRNAQIQNVYEHSKQNADLCVCCEDVFIIFKREFKKTCCCPGVQVLNR